MTDLLASSFDFRLCGFFLVILCYVLLFDLFALEFFLYDLVVLPFLFVLDLKVKLVIYGRGLVFGGVRLADGL